MSKELFVSCGSKGVMFTLRQRQIINGQPHDYHIKTLTNDVETSRAIAIEFADKVGAVFSGVEVSENREERMTARKNVKVIISCLTVEMKLTRKSDGYIGTANETIFEVWRNKKEEMKNLGFSIFKADEYTTTHDMWKLYYKGNDLVDVDITELVADAHRMEIERMDAVKLERAASQHVGEVKERLDITATCIDIGGFVIESFSGYGEDWVTISTFKDDAGNIFKYFNSVKYKGDEYREVVIDDVVSFKGTVKGHDEYKGQKQTVLTRCGKAVEAVAVTA